MGDRGREPADPPDPQTGRPDLAELSPTLDEVLRSAARLQAVAPDVVLMGGAAAALYAHHRDSFDHGHVLTDLQDRYLQVLEAVETTEGWVTSVRASAPPLTILGRLGGVEAGLRQLRRRRPLETQDVEVGDGLSVRVPTAAETLRVKAYLVVQRNQVRDYLDVAALADRYGVPGSARTLLDLDDYYADRSGEEDSVLTALVGRLSAPHPRDVRVTRELAGYRRLAPRWHDWSAVVDVCTSLADTVVRELEP